MKHYGDEVEEKETEPPSGGRERSQQHEDPDWDRTEHPKKPRKLVSLIDMSQAGNDTKDNRHGVTRFAFRRFSRAALPIASIAVFGLFWQEMPAVWTGHLISRSWFGASARGVRVLYTHFSH
jgi:hypothetical protein